MIRPYGPQIVVIAVVASLVALGGTLLATASLWSGGNLPQMVNGSGVTVDTSGKVSAGGRTIARVRSGSDNQYVRLTLAGTDPEYAESYATSIQYPGTVSMGTAAFASIQGTDSMDYRDGGSNLSQVLVASLLPESHTVVTIDFPKGTFSIPLYYVWWDAFTRIPFAVFVALGLLPLLGVLYYRKRVSRGGFNRTFMETEPPIGMSPLECAILLHGELRSVDLAALIYDLAERGWVLIIQQDTETYFIRTAQEGELSDVEKIVLGLLSQDSTKPSSLSGIVSSMTKELFSDVVSNAYADLYGSLEGRGYFEESLTSIHIRFKTAGIIIQLASLISAIGIYVAIGLTNFGPLLVAALWYCVGMIVYGIGYRIVPLSKKGLDMIDSIYGFIDYLTMEKPVDTKDGGTELFHKYLPYAVIAGVTEPWFHRFMQDLFVIPDWFSSSRGTFYPLDFLTHIDEITEKVSKVFVKVKDPNVD